MNTAKWTPLQGKATYLCGNKNAIKVFVLAMGFIRDGDCWKNKTVSQKRSEKRGGLCGAIEVAAEKLNVEPPDCESIFGEQFWRKQFFQNELYWLPPMSSFTASTEIQHQAYTARIMLLQWLILECEEALKARKRSKSSSR